VFACRRHDVLIHPVEDDSADGQPDSRAHYEPSDSKGLGGQPTEATGGTMAERQPAIGKDILQKPLGSISAVDFIAVLNVAKLSGDAIALLPDKKKYELWVDEGGMPKIPLGVLIEKLRREKKKLELEKRLVIESLQKRVGEFEIGPDRMGDPVLREKLIDEIADEVVRRIGK
jgi:hypothetical protein